MGDRVEAGAWAPGASGDAGWASGDAGWASDVLGDDGWRRLREGVLVREGTPQPPTPRKGEEPSPPAEEPASLGRPRPVQQSVRRRPSRRAVALCGAAVLAAAVAVPAARSATRAVASEGLRLPTATESRSAAPTSAEAPVASTGPAAATSAEVPRTTTHEPEPAPEPDWWSILGVLDSERTAALSGVDRQALGRYAQPGSAAWRSDADVIAELEERGLRPAGLATSIVAVEQVEWSASDSPSPAHGEGGPGAGADTVSLVVVDQRSGYRLTDAQGATVEEVPPAGSARWQMHLVRSATGPDDPGWRVVEVIAVPS